MCASAPGRSRVMHRSARFTCAIISELGDPTDAAPTATAPSKCMRASSVRPANLSRMPFSMRARASGPESRTARERERHLDRGGRLVGVRGTTEGQCRAERGLQLGQYIRWGVGRVERAQRLAEARDRLLPAAATVDRASQGEPSPVPRR